MEHSADNLPESLKLFYSALFAARKDRCAVEELTTTLGQALISGVRPKSYISPVLLSLAVYIHRYFGTRELIDKLNSSGLVPTYGEVLRYEYSATVHASREGALSLSPKELLQFSFDNADKNVKTLDGHGTFHGMGGIAIITPASQEREVDPISRINRPQNATEIIEGKSMPIVWYTKPATSGLKQIIIQDFRELSEVHSVQKSIMSWMAIKFQCYTEKLNLFAMTYMYL